MAGRSGPPDQFNEHTTDVSGRGNSPYVPQPALPPMPGEQHGGGLYPPGGPAARATVTPPGPEDTTSWPGPAEEQGRFDQLKADPTPPSPAPAKTNVRTVPVALAVVLGATLILAVVFGLVYLISRGGGLDVATGDCVKRSGDTAVAAECSEPDTFKVISIGTAKEQCGDAQQPHVIIPKDDGNQVLCLQKNG
jgi:hypothetical protein